ncbi:MAG: hypothetical protein KJ993_14210 [Actinobacteria bacterium]|nr:hypothetical protein [Actinomycetota bacterium]
MKFARFFDWRDDGTIVSTDRTKTRSQITFLEAGELESLFSDLSSTIGMSVDSILIQAQKNIGKAIYASLPIRHIKGLPANRFFRPGFMARFLVWLIAPDIAGLGDGRIGLDSYRAGDHLVLRILNPVVSQILVGSAAGIYESIEEMTSAAIDWRMEGSDLVIRLTHSDKPEEGGERLYLEEIKPGDGSLRLDRCPSCGVPLLAARMFSWEIDRGIIHNRLTGRREVVIAVQAVNAILRELESELGEEIPSILYGHQKDFTRSHLSATAIEMGGADLMDRHLMDMAVRGLGYPVRTEREAGSISVEITNAYNQVLYAAKIAACLEVETGAESSIEWVKREADDGVYTISV